MTDPSDDDRVGYKRPPREKRWKKGQSGDARRRKTKPAESLADTIDRMLLTRVRVTLNGEAQGLTALEAILLRVVQKTILGNGRAHRVLLKYLEFAGQPLKKKVQLAFSDTAYTRAVANSGMEDDDNG